MKIAIVDDETLSIDRLERLLRELGYTQISTFSNPFDAIEAFATGYFDIAFLDISMSQMDGLTLAQNIMQNSPNTQIIFQTAHSEHAITSYDIGAIDYLLKPYSKDRVEKAIHKAINEKKFSDIDKKLLAKSGNKIFLINLDDIYYIQADLDEIIIRTKDIPSAFIRRKISDIESVLDPEVFFKIHRSIIINTKKIKSIESVEQSKLKISFDAIDDKVTSSKEGAKEFRAFLERRSL